MVLAIGDVDNEKCRVATSALDRIPIVSGCLYLLSGLSNAKIFIFDIYICIRVKAALSSCQKIHVTTEVVEINSQDNHHL